MFQFIFRKNFKCIEELSIDAIEEHSFDEPVQRQTMRKLGVGRTLTVELPIDESSGAVLAVQYTSPREIPQYLVLEWSDK